MRLSAIAKVIGLHRDVLMPQRMRAPVRCSLGEISEAVIGAAYIESGRSRSVVRRIMKKTGILEHPAWRDGEAARPYEEQPWSDVRKKRKIDAMR